MGTTWDISKPGNLIFGTTRQRQYPGGRPPAGGFNYQFPQPRPSGPNQGLYPQFKPRPGSGSSRPADPWWVGNTWNGPSGARRTDTPSGGVPGGWEAVKQSFNPRPEPARFDPVLAQQATVNPNSLFKQWYDSAAALGMVGLASERDIAKQMADQEAAMAGLNNRLANSRLGLTGNLSGIEIARLNDMWRQDQLLHRNQTSDINAMQAYLQEALDWRNKQRFLDAVQANKQKPFIERAYQNALGMSRDEREAGQAVFDVNLKRITNARDVNLRQLLENFTGRGAEQGRGHYLRREDEQNEFLIAREGQQAQLDALFKTLSRRDEKSLIERDQSIKEIEDILDDIRLATKADTAATREERRKFDAEKGRLNIGLDRSRFNFQHAVAAERERKRAAAEQKRIEAERLALERARAADAKRAADAAYARQAAEAKRNAFFQAEAARQAAVQQQGSFWSQLPSEDLYVWYSNAWQQGNTHVAGLAAAEMRRRGL